MAEMKARMDIVGSDKTQRAFRSVRKNVTGFNSELKRTAFTFATAFGVKQLIDMQDSITDLRNRLNSFNNNAEKTAAQMDLLTQVALRTRSSFEATGVVFTRMIQATQHLKITNEELAAATATVNATFKLSGTTAYEAANSARQLAQGLSSGRLSGDEMRSVLENNVVLANLLADGFGVTVGQLREMGAAGKITTEKIMPILIGAFEETTTKVSNMQFTIDAAFQVMQVRLYEGLRAFNEFTNIQDRAANAIAFVAENINTIAAVAAGALVPAIGMATVSMYRFLASMIAVVIANPLTVLVTAAGAAFAYFLTISEELTRKTFNFFGKLFLQDLPNMFVHAEIGILTLQNSFAESINGILKNFQAFSDGIYVVINGVREFMGFDKLVSPELIVDVEGNIKRIEELENKITEFTLLKPGEKLPLFEDGGFLENLDPQKLSKKLAESAEVVNEFQADLTKTFDDFFSKKKTLGQDVGEILTKGFDQLADVIADFVTKGKASISDLVNAITNDLLKAMIRAGITDPLGQTLGTLFKQGGGQVIAGQPYVVGEKGAELFIPSSSGSIMPNNKLGNGGNVVINQSVNFATGIQDTVKNEVLQMLPEIAETSKAAVVEAMNRGGNFRRGMR